MRRFVGLLIASCLAGIGPNAAFAFDVFPEYFSLDDKEAASFDRPERLDSEYQSDVLTYQPRLSADVAFYSRERALDLSFGSLSGKQFLAQERVRLEKDLAFGLRFKFVHWLQEDYEEDREHSIFELQQSLTTKMHVALYGEATRDKEEIDIGAAILLFPQEDHEVRLFYTWADPFRSEKTLEGDHFIGSSRPNSAGLSGLKRSGPVYLRYGYRRDFPGYWIFPQNLTTYSFSQTMLWLDAVLPLNDWLKFQTRLQWDRKREGLEPSSGSASPRENRLRTRTQALFSLAGLPAGRWTYEPGLLVVERKWEVEGIGDARHANWLPHIWFSRPTKARTAGMDRFEVGLETTLFHASGPEALFSHPPPYDTVEGRLNLRYEFTLADQARLSFLVSADLDRFGRSDMFEGGNGQFLIFF